MFKLRNYYEFSKVFRQLFYFSQNSNRRFNQAILGAWGYTEENGPNRWAKLSESYVLSDEGKRQSPIMIDTGLTIFNKNTNIKLDKLDTLMTGSLKNTGQSIKYEPNSDTPVPLVEAKVDFPGLVLCNPFRLAEFHFHWGSSNEEGSEHVIDGKPGCGEIHFVYANTKYEGAKIAVRHADGLIVLGYMLSVGENSVFDELFKFMPEIKASNDRVENVTFKISQFFQDKQTQGGFYVYQGSLTTPPCYESVTWFLSPLPLVITQEQLRVLRSQRVDEHTQLQQNFRPLKPLNGRKVLRISCK
ncbi:Carbonic anhydrase 1-like [Oopsacas minuta]|uniref:carbonic anhydrase n=1 Tax=Oopsacas minuta TaxID=111878 RepID=A0AAV7K0G2_9METZ|nr:Carbonic anhydrase 1-like [Oopsacas minuta]